MYWWFLKSKSGEPQEEFESSTARETDAPQTAASRLLDLQHSVGNQTVQRKVAPGLRGGETLEPDVREHMESRFGEDLSMIRIHTDSRAEESTGALNAKAYTMGRDIYFSAGSYAPKTSEGQRLLAHELTHAIQQGKETATGGLETTSRNDAGEREAEHAASTDAAFNVSMRQAPVIAREGTAKALSTIADQVIAAINKPDPIAGIGDYPEAFKLLVPLPMSQLLSVLAEVEGQSLLDTLKFHIEAATNRRDLIEFAILAVILRSRGLSAEDLKRAQALAKSLDPADKKATMNFIGHAANTALFGEAEEVARLAELQNQMWEQQRQQEEEAARKASEEAAKQTGQPPPVVAPKVSLQESIAKTAEKRAHKGSPTEEWDKLSKEIKDDWDKRALKAWNDVVASVKGTELEKILAGKTYSFRPREALVEGYYAKQSSGTLVFGTLWVKDAEAGTKNVWSNIVHELGAHFEYGRTYASKIMDKALDNLPEADSKKIRTDPELWRKFFLAYAYSETEIYAALRQRRYDEPEAGPKPVHHAIKPDKNISNHLLKIKEGFPDDVKLAILTELKMRVDASPDILERDKKLFIKMVKDIVGIQL